MAEREPEQINIDDELKRLAMADPFVPFDIVTTSGISYEIWRPLQIAVGTTAVVILTKAGTQTVRKNQIVALHVHEPAE